MKTELEKGHILRKSSFNINVFITKDMILCYFQKHYKESIILKIHTQIQNE